MSLRFLPLLLAGLVVLTGWTLADEPNKTDDPPVRLKKKKRPGDEKPAVGPAKPAEKKKDDAKKDPAKDEARPAEPVTPQEEESGVLNRIVQNVRGVEDRLAKNDLGEGTRQTQRDILKDIESLIKMSDNPPPDSGEQQGQQNQQSQQKQPSGASKSKGQQSKGGKKMRLVRRGMRRQSMGQKMAKRQRSGRPSGSQKPTGKQMAKQQPGGKNGKNGNGGGGTPNKNQVRERNADLYKSVWGHLPETLRAEMDAYSNGRSFLPKYDDLIKRYYRTIAEQGRRKGE